MGLFDRFRKKKGPEVTPGGSPIYRYSSQEDKGLQPPQVEGVYLEEIEKRFDQMFPGRETRVFHEIVSDIVHIDVHIMWPTEEQNFFVLYTSGMSDLPMTMPDQMPPEHREMLKLAEVYLFLPGDWPIKTDGPMPDSVFWPIRMLKMMARFPHEYQTWLGWGHTIPNGPDYAPLDDSVGFGATVLVGGGDGPLGSVTTQDGQRINLYNVIPAYKEEIEYKLKYGMEGLEKVFDEKRLNLVLDPKRPNLCADFKETLDG